MGDKKQIEEDKKIDTKDIHASFWRCRDFELSNLWQRSIFLTAFLVLSFTAYGGLLSKAADKLKDFEALLFLNIIGYLLSIFGISLSIFWIKMGKGSKAWYEIYESAISMIEGGEEYATKKATKIGGFRYNKLDGFRAHGELDTDILTMNAGPFSVSKINIGLGKLFMFTWLGLGLAHAIICGFLLSELKSPVYKTILYPSVGIIIIGIVLWQVGRPKTFSSGSINRFYKQ